MYRSTNKCDCNCIDNFVYLALTSFSSVAHSGTVHLVWWKYWLDPFAVFPIRNIPQTMVIHLNFWHPTKPLSITLKLWTHQIMVRIVSILGISVEFQWDCSGVIVTYNFLSLGILWKANFISPNGLPRNSNVTRLFGRSSLWMAFIRLPDKNLQWKLLKSVKMIWSGSWSDFIRFV